MGIPDVYGCTEVFVVAVVLWAIICAELLGDHGITVVTTIVLSLGTAKLWSMFGWLTVVVPLLFTGLVFVGFLVVRLRNNRTQYERGVRARLVGPRIRTEPRPIGENNLGGDGAGIGGPQHGVPVPRNPRRRR
jgi:hypothetical protein